MDRKLNMGSSGIDARACSTETSDEWWINIYYEIDIQEENIVPEGAVWKVCHRCSFANAICPSSLNFRKAKAYVLKKLSFL